MSLALSIFGAASSFKPIVTMGNYLSIVPNGYAALSPMQTITASNSTLGATFRRNTASAIYLFGHSDNNSLALYVTPTQIVTSSGGATLTLNYATNTVDFYRVEVDRSGTSSAIRVFNEAEDLLGSIIGGALSNASITYTGRQANSYSNMDVKQLRIGSLADRNQHLWEPQTSGTTWNDTGTVGGWNLTLSGSPLPTWVT